MYSDNSLRMFSMSSAALSSANIVQAKTIKLALMVEVPPMLSKRPTPASLCGRLALVGEHCPLCHYLAINPDQRIGVDAHAVAHLHRVIEHCVLYSANACNHFSL